VGDRLLGGVGSGRVLDFVRLVLFMATQCIGKSCFSSGQGTWIKHGGLEPCEARTGALQGTGSATSLRTAVRYVSV